MKKRINKIIFDHLRPRSMKTSDDIKDHHNIVDDLGADSLDFVELTMAVEEEFEVEITDEELGKWVMVSDFYETIESKIK